MKALLITNDFPPMTGGEATWYMRICASIPADRLTVLAPHMPGDRAFDVRQPYRIVRRRVPTSPHMLARLIQTMLLLAHALSIVRRERIRVIHLGHLYLGLIGLTLKRFRGVRFVIYLHGGEMAAYMRFRAVRTLVRAIVQQAHTVVANSRFTRSRYEEMGLSTSRTVVLTMGVDVARFHPHLDARQIRAKYRLDGAKVILTVGRVIERKGHDLVIRALGRVQQAVGHVRYLIAGSGPEEERLRSLARHLGCLEQVVFAGHVPDDELPHLYATCDVFIMPSRVLDQRDGVEGFGIAFLEAGACGKPVIGGDSGGIADAVIDGVTGVLVDPTNVDEVAAVLTRLLLNEQEARRLGTYGRCRAEALESAWVPTLRRIWDDADVSGGKLHAG